MFFLKSSCCDSIINNILKQTGIRKRKKQIRKDSKNGKSKKEERKREREKARKRESEKERKRKRDKEIKS